MLTARIICLSRSVLFHVNNVVSRDLPSYLIFLKVHITQIFTPHLRNNYNAQNKTEGFGQK